MDWQSWIKQHNPHTTIQRSGATAWLSGEPHLIDDPEGPYEHLHDGASEIIVFLSGRSRIVMGDQQEFFEANELALLPADIPHNLFIAGDVDVLLFWLVAPNVITNKWRTTDFPARPYDVRIQRASLLNGETLPSDQYIHNSMLSLDEDQVFTGMTKPGQEAVLLVLEGRPEIRVGHLDGRLSPQQFVHVPVETAYSARANNQTASILLIETTGH